MTRREQTSGLESAEAIVKVITAFLQNVFFLPHMHERITVLSSMKKATQFKKDLS